MMKVTVLHTGLFGVNTLIVPLAGNKVFIVDPAACSYCRDQAAITSYLASNNLEPVAIVLTHGHFDHVSGLSFLRKTYPTISVLIHKEDADMIGADSARRQSCDLYPMGIDEFLPSVSNLPEATAFLEEGKTLGDCLAVGETSGPDADISAALADWSVLHTPGHTKGSVCLYNKNEKILISGDTLFFMSWGRTDLKGGSEQQMRSSLRRLAEEIDSEARVYPGHDRYGFLMAEGFPL